MKLCRPGKTWPVQALIVILLIGLTHPGQTVSAQGEEQREIKAAEQEERLILSELEVIEKQISQIEDRLVRIEADLKAVQKHVVRTEEETGKIERRAAELKNYLGRRLAAIYRLRDGGLLQVLLRAESVGDMFHAYRYLRAVLERDRRALEEYGQRQRELARQASQLKADQAMLYRLMTEIRSEKEKLEAARRKKTALLMKVHQRKELYLALVRSREESRERFIKEVIIKPDQETEPSEPPSTEGPRPTWPDFAGLKGRIPRPVQGKITGQFGRNPGPFNTSIVRHGLVFQTEAGAPVKAVLDGQVLYVGWLRGYGNIIILNHGQRYYTLTGGLAGLRHRVGQWVREGEVLGQAPQGGNSTKKDIYFEIRHCGQAVDPAQWLGDHPAG